MPSEKFLSGPGGVYCLNGTGEGVKTEFAENTVRLFYLLYDKCYDIILDSN